MQYLAALNDAHADLLSLYVGWSQAPTCSRRIIFKGCGSEFFHVCWWSHASEAPHCPLYFFDLFVYVCWVKSCKWSDIFFINFEKTQTFFVTQMNFGDANIFFTMEIFLNYPKNWKGTFFQISKQNLETRTTSAGEHFLKLQNKIWIKEHF